MSEYEKQHNVSVRLNESDYKLLLYLHEKFNRMSYGKVSLADVLRIAVKQLYMSETEETVNPYPKVRNSIDSFTDQTVNQLPMEDKSIGSEDLTEEVKSDIKPDPKGNTARINKTSSRTSNNTTEKK